MSPLIVQPQKSSIPTCKRSSGLEMRGDRIGGVTKTPTAAAPSRADTSPGPKPPMKALTITGTKNSIGRIRLPGQGRTAIRNARHRNTSRPAMTSHFSWPEAGTGACGAAPEPRFSEGKDSKPATLPGIG